VTSPLRIDPAIRQALGRNAPVVALESSVLSQGLKPPTNRDALGRMTAAIEAAGALAAMTAVVGGTPAVGVTPEEMERLLARDGVRKASARDLAAAVAQGADAATTVAATLAIAALAGIQLFATGGIGGVHRSPPYDESADLLELGRSPVIVVCAGAKAILDLPATWERLETYGVAVVGYRTDELPGFFTRETGIHLSATAESADEIAGIWRVHRALGRPGALLVVQPPPAESALPGDVARRAIDEAVAEAEAEGIRGAELTPRLLAAVESATGGRSVESNVALLEQNAALAGAIASALSGTH
jgi:pseudouridylate synthase